MPPPGSILNLPYECIGGFIPHTSRKKTRQMVFGNCREQDHDVLGIRGYIAFLTLRCRNILIFLADKQNRLDWDSLWVRGWGLHHGPRIARL